MQKIPINKKYLTISLYVLAIILISILFEKTIGNAQNVFAGFSSFFRVVVRILSPFVIGLLIAYLLNTMVRMFEQHLFLRFSLFKRHKKKARTFSVLLTYFIFIGFLTWLLTYLVPEVVSSVQGLVLTLQGMSFSLEGTISFYVSKSETVESLLHTFNQLFSTTYTLGDLVDIVLDPVVKLLSTLPQVLLTIYKSVLGVAVSLLDFVLGLIIAFYMLCEKENYATLLTKIIYNIFDKPTADKVFYTAKSSNIVFEKFLIGKAIDSTIIGTIFFIICLIISAPYPILLAVIIGVTNMIPYFGPFIGAVPVVLIVMLSNPILALWMILIITALQQFDGLFLGPKILGDSTGLKPIGVIFSIMVGGALAGVLGMFFGVPVFAVISSAFTNSVHKHYEKRYSNIPIDKIQKEPKNMEEL